MNRFVGLISLFTTFSLLGCGSGPKVTVCLSSPSSNEFRCINGKNGKTFQKAPENFVDWLCLNPHDYEELLNSCKKKTPGPVVSFCQVQSDLAFRCADGSSGAIGEIPFQSTENYICSSVRDTQKLINYCKQKRKEK